MHDLKHPPNLNLSTTSPLPVIAPFERDGGCGRERHFLNGAKVAPRGAAFPREVWAKKITWWLWVFLMMYAWNTCRIMHHGVVLL